MRDYVVITDSCCDLHKSLRDEYGIEYIKMRVMKGSEEFICDLDRSDEEIKEYYDYMERGNVITTTQLTIPEYTEAFEAFLKKGIDVLSISCSSGITGSVNASKVAAESLIEKYPDATIYCLDALVGTGGQGLLVLEAAKRKKEGLGIDDTAAWVEANKMKIRQLATVSTLSYLKRAGRVTGTAAFFGNMLQVKPIIALDVKGRNTTDGKVKGRKTSLKELAERTKKEIRNSESQTLVVTNADCRAEAEDLIETIKKEIKFKDTLLLTVSPTVAATVGRGMIGVFFFGDERTLTTD